MTDVNHLPHVDTNFLSAGGPENYTWNVIRSESDELMFRHAGNSGAKIFDGVRVTSIQFSSNSNPSETLPSNSHGRPISASYERKFDGKLGRINFDYLVDASGRAGILHTRYLRNRTYSKGLKNLAYWGYWTGTSSYGLGTERACSPFFEALKGKTYLYLSLADIN
jgi:flavin-dependent dehydrogenase